MKHAGTLVLSLGALTLCSLSAHAQFTQIAPLPGVTGDINTYTNGGFYPKGGNLTIGGVPFTLTTGGNGDTFVQQEPGGGFDFVTPVNVFGIDKAYTLMNSAFGSFGANIGSIEFVGSGGANAVFSLIEGTNIRDHFNGGFNNTISDPTVVTMDFGGGVRLDRQTFQLPSAFTSQTLTEVILHGSGGGFPQGEAFLAALTVQTFVPTAVPEPGSVALLIGISTAGIGLLARKCRK